MNDDEINQAIVEACGWRIVPASADYQDEMVYDPHGNAQPSRAYMPDYTGDLNAMHEAVATLDHVSQTTRYGEHLCQILDFEMSEPWTMHDVVSFSQADARECAEAFLRTIGKWRDE